MLFFGMPFTAFDGFDFGDKLGIVREDNNDSA